MLVETNENVRIVAETCGFGSSVNLYRHFQRNEQDAGQRTKVAESANRDKTVEIEGEDTPYRELCLM